MPLFDTHAHLDDEQLLPRLDSFLQQAWQRGVVGINAVGTTVQSSRNVLGLAERYTNVFASVGVHPNYCQEAKLTDWDEIVKMAYLPQVVAIGETGLDRYWDYCPIETQRQWFARHLELSAATGKPVVIHVRDSEEDVLELLEVHARQGQLNGIWHSFAGSWQGVQRCLEWGLHISFSGTVTFKKGEEIRQVARQVPSNRILIETDAPYLSPHPFRGQRPNHPSMIVHTAQCLAEIRQQSFDDFARLTTGNAQRLFGIPQMTDGLETATQ